MTVGMTSAILASIVCLTVAIAILLRRPRRPMYNYFSSFTFVLFAWNATSLAHDLAGGSIIGRFQMMAALCMPPAGLLFFRELLREHGSIARKLTRLSFVLSSALFILLISPLGDTLWGKVPIVSYVLLAFVMVLRGLHRRIRSAATDNDRKRLSYVYYGGLVALILGSGELLPGFAVAAALGHIAVTCYVYFLYQSIIARRLIDLVELLGKAAVLGVLTLVLATVYSLLVLWVGKTEQGLWLFNTLVASFVILISYDQVRPRVEEATAKMLFRERIELRQLVRRLLRSLRTTISLEEMRDQVLDALQNPGITHVGMYLQADRDTDFDLFGFRGAQPPRKLTRSQQPTLLQEIHRERRPILLEHMLHRQQDLPSLFTAGDATLQRELERADEGISSMRAIHASVIIPMLNNDRILGLITLGAEVGHDAFTTEEISTLLSLAEACAVVIENSNEYERRRERDRLAAVGEMATGMAHEIRNPLGAIKGAAQCLDPGQMPAEANELVQVIIDEVDRLNGVVTQFLEYARPFRGTPSATDVNSVITSTLRLLEKNRLPENVMIIRDLGHGVPLVAIDPEQLKQVLINLLLNGVQAMPKGGSLTVHTSLSHPHRIFAADRNFPRGMHPPTQVVITVTDSGEGIAPDDLHRIFLPFFTTKSGGTGLGLAISQRIIQSFGGRIEVTSRLGEGSSFSLWLPALSAAEAQAITATPNATATAQILHAPPSGGKLNRPHQNQTRRNALASTNLRQ